MLSELVGEDEAPLRQIAVLGYAEALMLSRYDMDAPADDKVEVEA